MPNELAGPAEGSLGAAAEEEVNYSNADPEEEGRSGSAGRL